MRFRDAAAGVALGAGVFVVGGLVLESLMAPQAPVSFSLASTKVSIHLPTYNEVGWVGETLQTLVDQTPKEIKIVVLDSNSTDGTADLARSYTPNVWQVPWGKLSARDYGFRNDDADIVVSTDAGDLYPQGWLSRILEPFSDQGVAATFGPILSRDWMWKSPEAWYSSLVRPLGERMSARNSSVRRSAYLAAGGFDLSVDQLDRAAMVQEEEVRFPRELRKVGRVAYVYGAGMYATERHRAPLTLENGRIPKYAAERESRARF